MTITRIKKFIRRQRYIGENQFADRMRKRYNKTAKEFFKSFADKVYYEKHGVKYGLDMQTLWYFRTNDMLRDENGHIIPLPDSTKEMLQEIISWEKDLSEYESLETILRDKYIISKR